MNKKQLDMIRFLSIQNRAVSGKEIAKALNVTTRSVKNYVHSINGSYGKNIITSSRNGYELHSNEILSLLSFQNNTKIPQTQEERSFYIIKQLILNQCTKLDLFSLSDTLCVSYSTVKAVISKMNKIFSAYHIEFLCENDHVYINGFEKDKRRLISYVINEEAKNSYINLEMLQKNFSNIDIDTLQKIIYQTFKKYKFYLNDFAALNLLLHLLIMIDRELNGNKLDTGESEFIFNSPQEEMFLNSLKQQIEQQYNIKFNDYEYFELYMLFRANANFSLDASNSSLKKVVGEDILTLTKTYVEEINNLYMIDLSSNTFTTPFALHLKNLIFRGKTGRFTKNPMTYAIKNNSPIVFDIAIYIALDLMKRYNFLIDEDETAFLAIHIGAEIERQTANTYKIPSILVCPNYYDMASGILNTLMMNFGNQLNLICSVADEDQLKRKLQEQNISIIFTTIPLTQHDFYSKIKVVPISPLNLTNQFDTIQSVILKEIEDEKNLELSTNFHIFFEKDLFLYDDNISSSKEQVLASLCDKLIEKNYVDPNFYENVCRRENAATTAFGDIAIPHSVEMDAIKTSIAVMISNNGIHWGSNTVYIIFLLAINKADKREFRNIYESLISLFSEPSIISLVRNCTCFKDLENLIYNKINLNK